MPAWSWISFFLQQYSHWTSNRMHAPRLAALNSNRMLCLQEMLFILSSQDSVLFFRGARCSLPWFPVSMPSSRYHHFNVPSHDLIVDFLHQLRWLYHLCCCILLTALIAPLVIGIFLARVTHASAAWSQRSILLVLFSEHLRFPFVSLQLKFAPGTIPKRVLRNVL